jgi:copper homeostasis protein
MNYRQERNRIHFSKHLMCYIPKLKLMSVADHKHLILEACVETLEEAIYAEQRGALRLELCANLYLDGTTPDSELIIDVLSHVTIPVKVMIRPREGDFVYSDEEFNTMLESIKICKSLGVSGVVSGILREDNTLDLDRLNILAGLANPLPVTVHKCIDLVPDIFDAIEALNQIPGVQSILSSGQADTAEHGAELLKRMLQACGEKLRLIVAGKVTQENLAELVLTIGAREYHGRRIVSISIAE